MPFTDPAAGLRQSLRQSFSSFVPADKLDEAVALYLREYAAQIVRGRQSLPVQPTKGERSLVGTQAIRHANDAVRSAFGPKAPVSPEI